MLLETTSIDELWAMLKPNMKKPAWPGLDDPQLVAKTRRLAKRSGAWKALSEKLDPSRPIEVIPYSKYRSLKRTGKHLDNRDRLMAEVEKAALALLIDHPKASAYYLEDLLWAACETTTWVCSFHEYSGLLDLTSTTMARIYAETLYLVGDRLEPEVTDRVHRQIKDRVLDPGIDYRQTPWWSTASMNWNVVCNTNLITAALYELGDVFIAHYLHPVLQRLHYGLRGFAPDGGCYEGPSYWEYAFTNYLNAALVLYHRTGGKLNLMDGQQQKNICTYPLVGQIEGKERFTFCDSGPGYLSPLTAAKINFFHPHPELYAFCPPKQKAHPKSIGSDMWRFAALDTKPPSRVAVDKQDYFFPDLRQVKVRPAKAKAKIALGAMAAHNAVPHNHNDVGTFIYHAHGQAMLTDPGGPIYTREVFGKNRYEHPMTRTRGHSLPIVNGHEQKAGEKYAGTMDVEGLNEKVEKRVIMELAKAYPDPTLKRLTRELTLATDGTLRIRDAFAFSRKPTSIEEAFATYQPTRVRAKGREVVIGKGRHRVVLRASVETPGAFRVDIWGSEATTWTTKERLRRIVFTPAILSKKVSCAFEVIPFA